MLLARKRLKNLQFNIEFAKLNINERLVISQSIDYIDDN